MPGARDSPSSDLDVRIETVRGARPDDPVWRADALAGSRHSRWLDELRQPLESHDRQRAARICAEVTRLALRDLAPALLLLDPASRLRLQALTAYSLTLFDFVRQTGLEGERLSAINRWEFDLESALDGRPPGQPVFVQLADLEIRTPWSREAFDLLHESARRGTARARPRDRSMAERHVLGLAEALAWLMLGRQPVPALRDLVAAILRVRALVDIGDDLRRHRCRLPITEVPDHWHGTRSRDPQLQAAIVAEADRLRPALDSGLETCDLTVPLRRALTYARRASLRLLRKIETAGTDCIAVPPRLSLLERLVLLVRCRST